ncbi:MAG: TolC family protein [Candidatus Puniceispirillaceae bacterium]
MRVPPTGIPKPDQDDIPALDVSGLNISGLNISGAVGRRRTSLLLAIALMVGAGMTAGMTGGIGQAVAADDPGVRWQFDRGLGKGPDGGSAHAGTGAVPYRADRQAAASRRVLRQMPGTDWQARPTHVSQAGAAADEGGSVPPEEARTAGLSGGAAQGDAGLPRRDIAPTLTEDRIVAGPGPTVLPDRLRQAVLLDPQVAEMSARACQLAHRLGLARAEGRPKVTATVTGSRQIVGRIKKEPRQAFNPETGRVEYRPGDEEIARSGAHTREFDHRERNNIYDGKISLRHTLIDWGEKVSRAEARSLTWQAAQIDARVVMRERSHDLLQLSLTLRRSDEVIAALKGNFDEVTAEVDAVRARVEAGAGRLSDLREAQLVQLDQEIAINRAEAERDIVLEHLETEFDLTADDAWLLAQAFLSRRHPDLAILPADRSDKAHAIRLRARGVTHEAEEIRASRYPKFDAVLDGTIFDMTDYEDEYELVGKLEMSVPLYDGGTARARLRETAWRENELKSSLEALVRAHGRETEGLAQRFNQMTREETEALARRDELAAQLRSLRERQGQTVSSPLAVARLLAQIGAAEAHLAEIRFDRELLRARALLVAEQIDSVLGLSMEDSVC